MSIKPENGAGTEYAASALFGTSQLYESVQDHEGGNIAYAVHPPIE